MITSQIDQAIGQLLLDIVLPMKLTSGNDGQGWSFYKSHNDRTAFGKYFKSNFCNRVPFGYPTFVAITRILGKKEHLFDYPNVPRGNAKQLIDAMVTEGRFWHDDGPEYITGIIFRQDSSQRDNGPAIRIQIWQSGDQPVRPKADTIAVAGRQKGAKVPRKRPARSSRSKSKRKLR